MDVEVRQAQRTLQRAGVLTLTDAVPLEEFPLQYGDLLLSWLKRQGLSCQVLRMQGRKSNSQWEAAIEFLKAEARSEVHIRTQFQFRSSGFCNAQMSSVDDNQVMAGYLANLAPLDVIRMFHSMAVQSKSESRPLQSHLFFFVEPGFDSYLRDDLWLQLNGVTPQTAQSHDYISVSGYVYMYVIPTPEDIAKEAARVEKATQKNLEKAAKRRKTIEAKEKVLLKKLQEKYSESDAS